MPAILWGADEPPIYAAVFIPFRQEQGLVQFTTVLKFLSPNTHERKFCRLKRISGNKVNKWQSMVLCKFVTLQTLDLHGLLRIASIGINTGIDLCLGSWNWLLIAEMPETCAIVITATWYRPFSSREIRLLTWLVSVCCYCFVVVIDAVVVTIVCCCYRCYCCWCFADVVDGTVRWP